MLPPGTSVTGFGIKLMKRETIKNPKPQSTSRSNNSPLDISGKEVSGLGFTKDEQTKMPEGT